MLIALYELSSKPGREKEFEKAWGEFTDAIYEVQGSLGSRPSSPRSRTLRV